MNKYITANTMLITDMLIYEQTTYYIYVYKNDYNIIYKHIIKISTHHASTHFTNKFMHIDFLHTSSTVKIYKN